MRRRGLKQTWPLIIVLCSCGVASRAEAWIETSYFSALVHTLKSPPVRRRGLKPHRVPYGNNLIESPPVRRRGLKLIIRF